MAIFTVSTILRGNEDKRETQWFAFEHEAETLDEVSLRLAHEGVIVGNRLVTDRVENGVYAVRKRLRTCFFLSTVATISDLHVRLVTRPVA